MYDHEHQPQAVSEFLPFRIIVWHLTSVQRAVRGIGGILVMNGRG